MGSGAYNPSLASPFFIYVLIQIDRLSPTKLFFHKVPHYHIIFLLQSTCLASLNLLSNLHYLVAHCACIFIVICSLYCNLSTLFLAPSILCTHSNKLQFVSLILSSQFSFLVSSFSNFMRQSLCMPTQDPQLN